MKTQGRELQAKKKKKCSCKSLGGRTLLHSIWEASLVEEESVSGTVEGNAV